MAYKKLVELGFTNKNTLFGDCTCPDEINHNDPGEDISSLFRYRWGQIFTLGGIGGLPFAGKTGWAAFSSHTPQNGNIVVVFAPHVGIDCDGNVGKVHRQGIDHTTTACGAAVGALNAVKADITEGDFKNGNTDHQMDCIKHLLAEQVESIRGHENEMAFLPYKMYDIIEQYLEEMVDLNWASNSGKLALIGGIMINCDGNRTDMFLPLKFEVRSKNGGTVDLTKECLGFESYQDLGFTSAEKFNSEQRGKESD